MGRGINIALVNSKATSRLPGSVFATFAALKHSWEHPLLLARTHTSVRLTGFLVLPTGRTGDLIKTEFFDMWAGGGLDWCSFTWGIYTPTVSGKSITVFLVQMWLP